MTIEFVGMIWPNEWSETKGHRQGAFDLKFLRDHLRAHEHAGFDRVLIASGPWGEIVCKWLPMPHLRPSAWSS